MPDEIDASKSVPLTAEPVVVDYSAARPHNRSAARALVFGLLGFFPFVPGIFAIVYGRRGLRDFDADPTVGGKGMAKAGLWLGIASVMAWTALSIAAIPASVAARRQAMRVQCASNLRQLAVAIHVYAANSGGVIPPDLDTLIAAGVVPAALLQCPAAAGDAARPAASSGAYGAYGYVYLGAGQHLNTLRPAASVPLVYEPLTNHADPGINVAFADGHVEMIKGDAAVAFLARHAASTRPIAPAPNAAEVE